jgi:hypothetical protein
MATPTRLRPFDKLRATPGMQQRDHGSGATAVVFNGRALPGFADRQAALARPTALPWPAARPDTAADTAHTGKLARAPTHSNVKDRLIHFYILQNI